MRAHLSLVQACVYGAGAFLAVVTACGAAAALAIGGPITKYETSNFGQAADTIGHSVKGAAAHFRAGVCRRLPSGVGHVLRCPKRGGKPSLATARTPSHTASNAATHSAAHRAPHQARLAHAPRHRPAHHPARKPH